MTDLPTRPCKLCGEQIMFATAPKADGKGDTTVPLNAKAPVYRITEREPVLRAERARDSFVSHWSTCEGVRQGKRP